MIHITDKGKCCGCTSCAQRCPKHCITLSEDSEGFLYPLVDNAVCIECGLCEKVCPILNPQEKMKPLKVLAVKNRNEEERMNSSSGGVFLPLAREIINEGGVVFGAVYDEQWEVHHVYTETLEGIYPMMGSKYLQSRIEDTYREAELFLKQGRKVMFVGSPCQIAGLRSFLRHKEHPNLLAVDILCHGVPSPGVWRRYLAETYSEDKAKRKMSPLAVGINSVMLRSLNAKSPIGDIKFRDKRESGWKKYHFVVRQKSTSKAGQNAVLSSDIHYINPFMQGFLSDIYLRPSCYECRCKNGANHSDMTIGDYWATRVTDQDFDDDKGVGLVLINSAKGQEYFDKLDMVVRRSTLEKANLCNGGLNEHTKAHPKRCYFFSLISDGKTVKTAVEDCLRIPLHTKVIRKVKRLMKIVRKWVLGNIRAQIKDEAENIDY